MGDFDAMREAFERMTGAFDRMTERFTELVARVDEYAADVILSREDVKAIRAEWERKTMNGMIDTLPPTTGPEDTTPPRGRRMT